jgi:hypothetical protein
VDGRVIVDGKAIVDEERDITKQEISLAGRPRGKRLIAPRTIIQQCAFAPSTVQSLV